MLKKACSGKGSRVTPLDITFVVYGDERVKMPDGTRLFSNLPYNRVQRRETKWMQRR